MEPLGIISVTITLFAVVLPRLAKEIVYVIGCPTSAIVKSTSLLQVLKKQVIQKAV
ncbi:hypothetical protein bcgnr5369_68600 [Bacillus cereus]